MNIRETAEQQENVNVTNSIIEQRNNFKLIKNTKGFNYEFKIIEDNLDELKRKVLEMNEWAKTNFSSQITTQEDKI